jgi:hypothetical protein
LPYRNIFAVLTWDSVIIYDTFHNKPLSIARGLHYANIVDAAWTADGHALMVCSTDGYISILRFAQGELGEVYHMPGAAVTTPRNEPAMVPSLGVAPTLLPPCEPGSTSIQAPLRKKTRIAPLLVVDPPTTNSACDVDVLTKNHKRTATEAAMAGAVDKLSLVELYPSVPPMVDGDAITKTNTSGSEDIMHTPPPPQAKKQKKRIQPMPVLTAVPSSS